MSLYACHQLYRPDHLVQSLLFWKWNPRKKNRPKASLASLEWSHSKEPLHSWALWRAQPPRFLSITQCCHEGSLLFPAYSLFLDCNYPAWRWRWTSANAWLQEAPIHVLMATEDGDFDELEPLFLCQETLARLLRKDPLSTQVDPCWECGQYSGGWSFF